MTCDELNDKIEKDRLDTINALKLFLKHIQEEHIIKAQDFAHFSEMCAPVQGNFVKWLGLSQGQARKLTHDGLMPSEWFIYFLTGYPITFDIKFQAAHNMFIAETKEKEL